ncbi:hypothetical protein HanRHA438_Chr11g0507671 [Helianthus annuus]|nr:hypothetical protein HanIR_Chr11g0533051 [Helianthus annuus]KAJ0871045.1 hypothetical protein HanRHA438_Chr11g0507671 [Helianthus annuus]
MINSLPFLALFSQKYKISRITLKLVQFHFCPLESPHIYIIHARRKLGVQF